MIKKNRSSSLSALLLPQNYFVSFCLIHLHSVFCDRKILKLLSEQTIPPGSYYSFPLILLSKYFTFSLIPMTFFKSQLGTMVLKLNGMELVYKIVEILKFFR